MNIQLNPLQTNTHRGEITLLASVDLTGKENFLLKIVNDGGVAKFALPTAITDICPFVCASGDVAGKEVQGESPGVDENCRVRLTGTCVPGDKLCLSATYGTVYVPAGSAGSLLVEFIAEEAGVANQDVKCRRIPARLYTF